MGVVERLRARREELLKAAHAACDPASDMKRSMTEDEQRAYDTATLELEQVDARIKELTEQEQRAAAADAVMSGYRGRSYRRDDQLTDSFRSMLLERNPAPVDVRWEQPRSVYQPGLERRDMVTTSPSGMAPVSFYGQLVEHMVESSAVLRAGATLLTTDSGETLRVPRSTANSTAAIVTEGAAIGESDPTLSSVELGAFKYGVMVQVSTELLQDSGVDVQSYLARETGRAIGTLLGQHLISGTGTGQPRGVLTDATTGVTGPSGTSSSFGSQSTDGQGTDLIYDLIGSVAEPYVLQPSAGFLMRNATLTELRKLKGSDGAETDFVKPGTGGASATIAGFPAYIDPSMPAMAAAAESVAFGDWSRYFVRMVNGVRFERSDDYAFNADLVTFRALLRVDARLIDTTGAIKAFTHSTV